MTERSRLGSEPPGDLIPSPQAPDSVTSQGDIQASRICAAARAMGGPVRCDTSTESEAWRSALRLGANIGTETVMRKPRRSSPILAPADGSPPARRLVATATRTSSGGGSFGPASRSRAVPLANSSRPTPDPSVVQRARSPDRPADVDQVDVLVIAHRPGRVCPRP